MPWGAQEFHIVKSVNAPLKYKYEFRIPIMVWVPD